MKKQFFKFSAVLLTAAVIVLNMSCKDKKEDPVDPKLSVLPVVTDIEFEADGSTISQTSFSVYTNQSKWEAASNQTWLTVNEQQSDNTFTLSAAVNTSTEPSPEATITVRAGEATPVTFTATQKGNRILTWVNITDEVLKNTEMPFTTGEEVSPGFWRVTDWIANAAAAANGNSAEGRGFVLSLWNWMEANPMENAKLYQTVELKAGAYRVDVYIYETRNNPYLIPFGGAYLAVADGIDLPDTEFVEELALAYTPVPMPVAVADNGMFSMEFELSEDGYVSLGFVVTFSDYNMIHLRKVELWELQ